MSCTVSGVLSQSIKNPGTNQTYLKENFFFFHTFIFLLCIKRVWQYKIIMLFRTEAGEG